MNYCVYCKAKDSNLPLLQIDLDFGLLGKAEETAYIRTCDDQTYIEFQIAGYGLAAKTLTKRFAIEHCPKCNRNLLNQRKD